MKYVRLPTTEICCKIEEWCWCCGTVATKNCHWREKSRQKRMKMTQATSGTLSITNAKLSPLPSMPINQKRNANGVVDRIFEETEEKSVTLLFIKVVAQFWQTTKKPNEMRA